MAMLMSRSDLNIKSSIMVRFGVDFCFPDYEMWKKLYFTAAEKEYLAKHGAKSLTKLWTVFLITERTETGWHVDVFVLHAYHVSY